MRISERVNLSFLDLNSDNTPVNSENFSTALDILLSEPNELERLSWARSVFTR